MRTENPPGFMSLSFVRNVADAIPEIQIDTRNIADIDARMTQYLDDQSNISSLSRRVLDPSMDEDIFGQRHLSGFEEFSIAGSRKSGNSAVSAAKGRVACGMPEGYGIEGSPVRFKIDLKPKDPPVFVGKSTYDIEIWVK